jgi:hypothetical protein
MNISTWLKTVGAQKEPLGGLVMIPFCILKELISCWLKHNKLAAAALLLCISAFAQTNTSTVTLAWDPSPEPDVAKYVLKQGQISGQYTRQIEVTNLVNGKLATTNTVTGLAYSTTFYFVVTAKSPTGLESPPSNEVAYTTPAKPYGPPANLRTITVTNREMVVTVTIQSQDQ